MTRFKTKESSYNENDLHDVLREGKESVRKDDAYRDPTHLKFRFAHYKFV